MFNIAVCDDEAAITDLIEKHILAYREIMSSVSKYTSGEALVQSQKAFDLIFLDIDMKGMNGIDAAREIRKYDKRVKIVYVTSYRDYTAPAFSVHAFAYLLKPVKADDIHKIMKEACDYTYTENTPVRLSFETTHGRVVLDIRQIYYFEYENRHVKMVTENGVFYIRSKIADMASKMQDYGFYMPHKSFIVNFLHVQSMLSSDIHMTNGDTVMLSQKRASEFRKTFAAYIENNRRLSSEIRL